MSGKQSLNETNDKALAREPTSAPSGEARFMATNHGHYVTDASNYREAPIEVVVPEAIEDVAEIRLIAMREDAPTMEAQ